MALIEPTSTDEEALVQRARRDRAAFGEIYDRYVERLYRFAYRRTTSHVDAEDVTAETFRRAIEGIGRYDCRGRPFGAWLFGIAANVLRERSRSRAAGPGQERLTGLDEDREPSDQQRTAIELLVEREEASALWQLVAELPLDLRRVLVLRYAWDLPYADVARRLGRSELACKQLSYRALKKLRARVAEVGQPPTGPPWTGDTGRTGPAVRRVPGPRPRGTGRGLPRRHDIAAEKETRNDHDDGPTSQPPSNRGRQ